MKKLIPLSLLSLFLIGCDEDSAQTTAQAQTEQSQQQSETPEIKAVQPEQVIDAPFTKNEKGTVIFNSVTDMIDALNDYNSEDKTFKLISEKPLSFQLFPYLINSNDEQRKIEDVQEAIIYGVYRTFMHTNAENVTVEVIPVDMNTNKPLKKYTQKVTVSREKALEILKAFSSAASFDDLVSMDTSKEFHILGLTYSPTYSKFKSEKFIPQIVKALKTGKVETPTEEVMIPLNVDIDLLHLKLAETQVPFEYSTRTLNDGRTDYELSLGKYVKIESLGKNKNIDEISVQFAFSDNKEIILNTFVAFAISSLSTPNPDNTVKTITTMVEKAGKQLKGKQDIVEIKQVVDGITLELKVFKQLGGISYLTIKKLETRPVKFN